MLSKEDARRFYNRMGARQDWQWVFEGLPVMTLLEQSEFGEARAVVEFGCGTGHVAEILMERYLSDAAVYYGYDISPIMNGIAVRRLERYGDRVRLQITEGAPEIPAADSSVDRFLSTYVLDLLPAEDISAVLNDAYRVLRPDGLVCLAGLTFAQKWHSRAVMSLWTGIHSVRPWLVGGCRPIRLTDYLGAPRWEIAFSTVVTHLAMPTELIVARKKS
ncbi:MAG: class I SAM-dependent methyltransferase [Blastocatellia bacterium]